MGSSLAAVLTLVLAIVQTAAGEAQIKTAQFANSPAGFEKMGQRIDAFNARNLLARAGVKVLGDVSSLQELVDGSAGVRGESGRVSIDGQPSVIAFYLGQAKAVHEVGVFTFNGDTRANQDFEVRFADNTAHPGQRPQFTDAAKVTTGSKILGADGGGFHTSFAAADGSAIVPGKVDWVEFRIWRTYPTKAGEPAKTKTPQGWTSVVELEVLGDAKDVLVVSPEQKARAAKLKELGKQPPYEKKGTWQETMLASREALLRWERQIDELSQPPMAKLSTKDQQERTGQRLRLYDKVKSDFTDAVSIIQIQWEQWDSIWVRFERRAMAGREYFPTDWQPGNPRVLVDQYNLFTGMRAAAVEKELKTIEPVIGQKVEPWLARFTAEKAPDSLAAARARYYAVATVQEAMREHHQILSMRLAVRDQQAMFGDRYAKGAEYLKRIDALEGRMVVAWGRIIPGQGDALATLMAVRAQTAEEGKEILLANPLLSFDKLLVGKGGPGFASNWGGPNNIGNELAVLSPVKPDGKVTTVYKGGHISDMDLSFDARKILFADNNRINEVNVDGTGHRQITTHTDPHTKHYDVARLPDGKIVFVSTACEQAVPCTGEWYVGNLHLIDDDGKNERRLCFDQDHDWNPCVLNNGQVIYSRVK